MDPLSLTASLIAVIQLTGSVISAVYNYRTGVRSAPEDAARIIQDLTGLSQILEKVLRLVEKEKASTNGVNRLSALSDLATPDGPLESCRKILERLNAKLVPEKGWRATRQALTWPLKQDHIKSALADIAAAKSTLDLALAVDQTTLTLEVKDKIEALATSFESFQLDEKTKESLTFLRTTDPSRSHLAACKKHQEGTGDWFLTSKQYLSWTETPGSFLWINGIPGCGKTVLCAATIEDLLDNQRTKKTRSAVVYYYFTFQSKSEQQFNNLLRSLIFQLACQCRELPQSVAGLRPRWEVDFPNERLIPVLNETLLSFAEVYLVIDALDECEQDADVLGWIQELVTMQEDRLRLMVSSRQDRRLNEALNLSTMSELALNEKTFHTDVQSYIQEQLRTDARMKKWPDNIKADVEVSLLANSGGLFRWVDCQLDVLRKCIRINNIKTILDTPPKTLNETYDRIIDNIDEAYLDDACKMLQWLTFATRPLRVNELNDALSFDRSDPENPTFDPQLRLPILEDVLELCSSLVTISEAGNIPKTDSNIEVLEARLAHNSVKDYLVSQHVRIGPHTQFFLEEKLAHSILAECCLAYLLQLSTRLDAAKLAEFPLAVYGAKSWADHYRRAKDVNATVLDQLALRLFMDSVAYQNCCSMYNPDRKSSGISLDRKFYPSAMYYTALTGLSRLIKPLVDNGFDHSEVSYRDNFRTPISAAAYAGHVDVIQTLLSVGASPDDGGEGGHYSCPIAAAASQGHNDIVRLFIAAGANIDKRGDEGQGQALYEAVSRRRVETTKILVDAGASIDAYEGMSGIVFAIELAARRDDREMVGMLFPKASCFSSERCLRELAYSGHRELFETLMQTPKGRDLGLDYAALGGWDDLVQILMDEKLSTPTGAPGEATLYQAVASGSLETTQIIYENTANDSIKHDELDEVMAVAAANGHNLIVQYLLDRGASLSSAESQKSLVRAAEGGHLSTVQVLLSAGMSANSSLHSSWLDTIRPCIWGAIERGHSDIARLLISFGADLDIECNGTSLLAKCIETANEEVFNILLEKGASTATVPVKDAHYDQLVLPLHYAAKAGSRNILRKLLEHGLDVNEILTPDGWTALFHAAKAGRPEIIQLLIDHGADIHRTANKGTVAIHTAAYHNHVKCVEIFLNAGVDVDVKGRSGRTSLHWATQQGSIDVVQFLLLKGADITIKDEKHSMTAIEIAKDKVSDLLERRTRECPWTEPGDDDRERILEYLERYSAHAVS